jgi:hypothetical protein
MRRYINTITDTIANATTCRDGRIVVTNLATPMVRALSYAQAFLARLFGAPALQLAVCQSQAAVDHAATMREHSRSMWQRSSSRWGKPGRPRGSAKSRSL